MSVRRVHGVQTKLRRVAELKLVELQRRQQALQAEEAELTRFLGGDSPFAGVLSATIVRRLRRNSQEQSETRQEKERQEASVLEQAAREKLAERMIGVLEDAIRRSTERRELGELIERVLARSHASFP